MQGATSRFITNIVPLQNVQTNVSGQGVQQTILTNISALQSAVSALQTSVLSMQASLSQVQASLAALQAKVG